MDRVDAAGPRSDVQAGPRADFVRPVALALAFTMAGELLIFAIWGLWLFPAGPLWGKLGWTLTCGVGMGGTTGALVVLLVAGRLEGIKAGIAAAIIWTAVLAYCVVLCYRIDLEFGWFGAREAPVLFVHWGGLLPTALASLAYGWLLHSTRGRLILESTRPSKRQLTILNFS